MSENCLFGAITVATLHVVVSSLRDAVMRPAVGRVRTVHARDHGGRSRGEELVESWSAGSGVVEGVRRRLQQRQCGRQFVVAD